MNINGICIAPWTAEDYDIFRRFDKAGTGDIAMDMVQNDREGYSQTIDTLIARLDKIRHVAHFRREAAKVCERWEPCVVIRMHEYRPPNLFKGERNIVTDHFRETPDSPPTTFVAFYDVTTLDAARKVVNDADTSWLQFNAVLGIARERVRELLR